MGDDERVRGTRMGRAAKITGMAAGVAAREASARALSRHSPDAATRQQLRAAQSLVKMFAGMKGAAMKVGQTLSAVDLGLVPEEVRPQWQEILAVLQQGAEPVSFKAIGKVIEGDHGEKLHDLFADIDPEPLAAASIGQVHKAELHDGRVVAVKVQYPGIAEAIHADMQNMRLGLKLLSVIAPGLDTAAIADEIRERIGEELDYELEAANHRDVARVYRGHPFVVVPDVVTSLSRERVIVTEFVEGERFAAVKDRPQAERDRLGEILTRFYVNGPLRHRLLNGDPHPGNSLFLADGRVAFLDFGFFKHLSAAEVRQIVACDRATYERDGEALMALIAEMGGLPPNPALEAPFLEAYTAIFGWIFATEPLTVETSKTAEMMRHYTTMRSAGGFEDLVLPAEHIVLMRSVMLLIGLLGQLRATHPWLEIGREWLLGDEPGTELGRHEAAFFGDRYVYAATSSTGSS